MTKPAAKKTAKRAEQQGNLIALNDETKDHKRFVSLVNRPANQRGFTIVRSAAPVIKKEETPAVPMKRIKRLASASPVIRLAFPSNFTENDVAHTLKVYGMSDYAVSQDDGKFIALRSDLEGKSISEDTPTYDIRMSSDGITATVEGEPVGKSGEPALGVSVARFEFDSKTFDNEAAGAWMIEKKVDFSGSVVENPEKSLLYIEVSPVEEDTEVRRLEVEPGVTLVIVRDDSGEVPEDYATAINEAAYGSWGWGQLDFNASLADRTVSAVIDDAIYVLSSVLRNIVFYSQVPTVDARKQLIEQACAQFADFANSLLDTLPRQVVSIVGRTEDTTEKETSTMTKQADATKTETTSTTTVTKPATTTTTTEATPATKTTTTEPEVKTDAEKTGTESGDAQATVEAVPNAHEPVTRAEFNELKNMLAAALDKSTDKGTKETTTEATRAEASAPLTKADLETVTQGITESVTRAVKESLGETIVRGQNTDQATQTVEEGSTKTPAKESLFRGAIPGLPRKAPAK